MLANDMTFPGKIEIPTPSGQNSDTSVGNAFFMKWKPWPNTANVDQMEKNILLWVVVCLDL